MTDIYESIKKRTGGDIYIGVVGPVRSGKSTFIKKFMDTLVIPNISDADNRTRTIDELPQSSSGRTVMTTQPNFIPQQAVEIVLDHKQNLRVRLVDCVGYMIKGANGDTEDGKPRMVKTPWFKQAIPFEKAARIGTQKVITDHSTIGVVVTCDGTITDIPRENYIAAEEQVITQLKEINKPFVVVVNSQMPESSAAQNICKQIQRKFAVPAIATNCSELDRDNIEKILSMALTQFPIKEIRIKIPKWIAMQTQDFEPKAAILQSIRDNFENVSKISEIQSSIDKMANIKYLVSTECLAVDYGTGCVTLNATVDQDLYFDTLKEITGTDVKDNWALMQLIQNLIFAKKEYDILAPALRQVEATGYGIVMPQQDELKLEEPEVVKQGTKYGIKLTASAPSLHILKANISTTVSPIIANETSGEDLVMSMMKNFENNPIGIWQSNLFGNSLQELVNQGLNAKLANIPPEARFKLVETIEKVVNDGCQGLICIIL